MQTFTSKKILLNHTAAILLRQETLLVSSKTKTKTKQKHINPEARNTQETIHISNDTQEEGRRGPWF